MLVTGVAQAIPFLIDLNHDGDYLDTHETWTPSPYYDPSTTMYFSGSLWSVDSDGINGGDNGIVMWGDRDATITDIVGGVHNADPMLSQRGFNWLLAAGDPALDWTPDVPDGDPAWPGSGSERYGLAMAFDQGVGVLGGGMTSGTDWQMGLWPWPTIGYDGSVETLSYTWDGDGPGGVNDHFNFKMLLKETNGAWDDPYKPASHPLKHLPLKYGNFLLELDVYEIGNMITLANGTVLNQWQGGGTMTPTPEPTTMLLFGSGLIGLAGFRRKFKKSYMKSRQM